MAAHRPVRGRLLSAAVALGAAAVLAACSSGGGSTASSAGADSDAGKADLAAARAAVEKYYSNISQPGPTSGPTAVAGKKVLYLNAGTSTPSGAASSEAAEQAAKTLGWQFTNFDGKFTPSTYQEGLRQAISSKQDGVILYGVDCSLVKQALEEVKQAGIVTVGLDSQDCSEASPGTPALFDRQATYPSPADGSPLSGVGVWEAWGTAQAEWLIAKTNGAAKVVEFAVPDFAVTAATQKGFEERLAKCPGCSLVETIPIGVADFGPGLQEKAQQALLKHPDATAVQSPYDDLITLGIAGAVTAAGRDDLLVVGGIGYPANIDLIRDGKGQSMAWLQDHTWDAYAGMDTLNRIFADSPAVNSGQPVMVLDKDHNLPPAGQEPKLGTDFVASFDKIWSGSAQ